jgi:hypothetical protein
MMRSIYIISVLCIATLCISCSPNRQHFDKIGVLEGFYGTPWSHEARLDMVRFMGDVGMNSYFYAPKDDPYHRAKWRLPYTGEKLREFRELVEVSKQANVDLFYAISPGLDMVYSDSADVQALQAKLQDMVKLGVHHFALFLDDVPEKLRHEADKQKYQDLAEAHAELINHLWAYSKENGFEFVVCPTTYTSAWGSRDYIKKLAASIPESIPLFWTGEDVAVAQITEEEAENWKELIKRKPLIWDNFPVNDFEGWRPILGPIRGRSASLPKSAEGILANPMDLPYSSMIPLYTVAEYGKNPAIYNPETAIRDAVLYLAGEDAFAHVMPVVKVYSDYGWTDNLFTPVYTPGKPLDEKLLYSTLDSLQYHLNSLRDTSYADNEFVQHFVKEIEPFVHKTRTDLTKLLKTDRTPVTLTSGFSKKWDDASFTMEKKGGEWIARLEADEVQPNNEWVMIITDYEHPPKVWLQPEDLIIRWDLAESEAPRADHFYLTPFSQKGISDIKVRTITSFFEHFTQPADVELQYLKRKKGPKTYYEVRFPAPSAKKIRFNMFLNPGHMLSKQPYLGNPFTYPVLVNQAE